MSLLHDRPARVEALGAVPTDGVEDLLRRVPPDPYLDPRLAGGRQGVTGAPCPVPPMLD